MRTLIIPDIHHHTEAADRWLASQGYDRVVFLGDFFDSFGDNVTDARRTAVWLRNRIDQTDDVFLLGNHDAAYRFPDFAAFYCPGFSRAKARAINEILKPKQYWDRFKVMHIEQGWVLSHAGFHPEWWGNGEGITQRCEEALRRAVWSDFDPLFGAGYDRGGSQPVGGPLWLDWSNFIPIPGINQIVGHTPGAEARLKRGKESRNYCLDVRNGSAAALLVNGRITLLHNDNPKIIIP